VTRITLPPPPPPPPPKPPEPEKVVETPKLQEPKLADKKPDKAPPKPQQPPASPLTAEAGAGANPYGLAVGDGSGNVAGGGGAAFWSYGRTVSSSVLAALRQDDKLRFANFVAELRIWLDAGGTVTRVQLASSSGDPAVDAAMTRSLTGLAMHEPPPAGMPQPIRLRTKSAPGGR
jgi:TonB family protein